MIDTGDSKQPFRSLPNIAPDFGNDWLSNAHEIALPEAVSAMPQLSVLLWGLLLFLLVFGCGVWARYRSYRSFLYRRQALNEFKTIEASLESGQYGELAKVSSVLKRVALTVWPRIDVVQMGRDEWLHFLSATSTTAPPSLIADLAYQELSDVEAIGADRRRQILEWSHAWISNHHDYLDRSIAQLLMQNSSNVKTNEETAQ